MTHTTDPQRGVDGGVRLLAMLERLRELVDRGKRLSLPRTEALLWTDTIIAAERRRVAAVLCNLNMAEWHDLEAAIDDEDAALAALTAHLCGEEASSE